MNTPGTHEKSLIQPRGQEGFQEEVTHGQDLKTEEATGRSAQGEGPARPRPLRNYSFHQFFPERSRCRTDAPGHLQQDCGTPRAVSCSHLISPQGQGQKAQGPPAPAPPHWPPSRNPTKPLNQLLLEQLSLLPGRGDWSEAWMQPAWVRSPGQASC